LATTTPKILPEESKKVVPDVQPKIEPKVEVKKVAKNELVGSENVKAIGNRYLYAPRNGPVTCGCGSITVPPNGIEQQDINPVLEGYVGYLLVRRDLLTGEEVGTNLRA